MRAGEQLGPYELLSPLGAGGMGEVWKARDTRLNRTVAIKFSQAAFTDRFEREARAIAALNHPHICQIYDVGPNYLVMEFVDGAPVAPPGDTRRLLAGTGAGPRVGRAQRSVLLRPRALRTGQRKARLPSGKLR